MSTDNNDFDHWLKKKLWRDLLFRSVIWIGIASGTGYLAVFYQGIQPLQFLDRMSRTLGPLANAGGTFSLLLCLLALMLKDLEVTLTNPKQIAATRGYLGGAVRRLAGDLSLWTLGAFTTMLATSVIALSNVTLALNEYAVVGGLGVVLIVMSAFIAIANVYVRRAGPTPLVTEIRNPLLVTAVYSALLVILIGRLLYRAA